MVPALDQDRKGANVTRKTDDAPAGIMSIAEVLQTPGYLMRRAHQYANAAYAAVVGTNELTGVQLVTLLIVRETADLSVVRIAERIGYDKMTTSRILRGLEKKGYLTRTPSPGDRRELLVACTPEGEAVAARVSALLPLVRERVLQPLSPDEAETLMALLTKLEQSRQDNTDLR